MQVKLDTDGFSKLLVELYSLGEAPAGSRAERLLAERVASVAEEVLGRSARLVPLRVAAWLPGEAYIEACGRVVKAFALPPFPGFVVEDIRVGAGLRIVDLHNISSYEDAVTEYWLVAGLGAEAVVVTLDKPRRLVFPPAPPLPSTAMPPGVPVVGVSERDAAFLKGCGSRVRIVSHARLVPGTGYTVESVEDEKVLFTAHHDHWLGGAVDNLSGVLQALAAAAEANGGFISFTAEEFGPWPLRSWYWGWGSRSYVDALLGVGVSDTRLVVNFDMAVWRPLVTGSEAIGPCIAGDAGLAYGGRDDLDTDSYSFSSAGWFSVTISPDELPPWYHSASDKPDLVDPGTALRLARRLAEAARRAVARLEKCSEHYLRGLLARSARLPLPLTRRSLYKLVRAAEKRRRWREAAHAVQQALSIPLVAAGDHSYMLVLEEPPMLPSELPCPGYLAAGEKLLYTCPGGSPPSRGLLAEMLDKTVSERLEEAYAELG